VPIPALPTIGRSLREGLASVTPTWLINLPGFRNLYSVAWTICLIGDCLREIAWEGQIATYPGACQPDALVLHGQSRGLLQGEAESNDHFGARLRAWRVTGNQQGKQAILAQQIQQYLGNNPLVRVIQRLPILSGPPVAMYVTANTDGTVSETIANWDWDSISGYTDDVTTYVGPVCRGFWADAWIVVYPGEWSIAGLITPLTGQRVPVVAHEAILNLVAQWKGEHIFVRAIMFSYNALLFDPTTPGHAGNPDGTWGYWHKIDNSGNVVAARNLTDVRYWIPAHG
jgi:hypothetical protein